MFGGKKLIILILALLFIIAAGYMVFTSQNKNASEKEAQRNPQMSENAVTNEEPVNPEDSGSREATTPQRITLEGRADCIPLRDRAAVDSECIFGIKTESGDYYILDTNMMSATPPLYDVDERIRVTGIITPIENLSTDKWQKYFVKGIFSVTDSFEKL